MLTATVTAVALKLRDAPDGDPLGDDAVLSKGDEVELKLPDDGSGWLMVLAQIAGNARLGFVPSSGVQIRGDQSGPVQPPKTGGQPGDNKTTVVPPPEPPDDPVPLAAFEADVGSTYWPVVDPGPNTRLVSYHPSPDKTIGNIGRCFFDDRPGRHHVGVDLFAEEGDPVVACADGKIVSFYKFYNSKGRDTFALVIAHDGVVINYGEVAPDSLQEFGLKIGDSVKAGQTVGRIGATGMLHFETYEPGTKQNTPWMDGQPRPLSLQNPTQLLFSLAATGKGGGPAVQGPQVPVAPVQPVPGHMQQGRVLSGVPVHAPAGLHGFDCDSVLSSSKIAALKAAGFTYCLRYISLGQTEGVGDLTNAEAERILSGGLGLMPVQHVLRAGWTPSAQLGAQIGRNAAQHAANDVGIPDGIVVWADLEGIATGTPASAVIDYCNAWINEVESAGYISGVYVGANAILSGDELYYNIKTTHYWKSGSQVPNIPLRGYQMVQRIVTGDSVAGVGIDRNVTLTDGFGGTVIWLARQ
jgi:murein DD-endopeptidase MepM/ murein hydrolase activator NlpD